MYLSRVRLKPEITRSSQLGRLLQSRTYGTHQLLWDLFTDDASRFLFREEIAREQLAESVGVKGEPVYYLLSEQAPTETPLFEVESRVFDPQLSKGQRLAFKVRVNPVVTRKRQRHDLLMDEQLCLYGDIAQSIGLKDSMHSIYKNKKQLKSRLLSGENEQALRTELHQRLEGTPYFSSLSEHPNLEYWLELVLRESTTRRLQRWLTDNQSRRGVFTLAQVSIEDPYSDREFDLPDLQYSAYRKHPLPEKGEGAGFRSIDLSGELIVQDPERFLDMLKNGVGPAKGFGCGLMMIKPA